MNSNEYNAFFKKHVEVYSKSSSTQIAIRDKIKALTGAEDDTLITLNMGLTLLTVPVYDARKILQTALETEVQYQRLLSMRMNEAVAVLNGEHDKELK